MIFNELYSAYYNAVAKILSQILDGDATEKRLNEIVCENAFGESMLTILPSLKSGRWQLIRPDMTTPIKRKPTMPLTLIQKQWLKAISIDPRIRLFDAELNGLDDIEPLFTPDDYFIYDKYIDGDPYGDKDYIARFKTILSALKDKHPLKIKTATRKDRLVSMVMIPIRLEYSEKDDKFRLIGSGRHSERTVNLARIISCERYAGGISPSQPTTAPVKRSVTLRIWDERNALERAMLHFAHFEKQAERIDKKQYLVHIKYDKADETEVVIRILGFGPMVEVVEPDRFRNLIIDRLQRQMSCELS